MSCELCFPSLRCRLFSHYPGVIVADGQNITRIRLTTSRIAEITETGLTIATSKNWMSRAGA